MAILMEIEHKFYMFKTISYYFCLGSVSKDFTNDEINEIYIYMYKFWTNYDLFGIENIVNIYEYWMKKYNIKWFLNWYLLHC